MKEPPPPETRFEQAWADFQEERKWYELERKIMEEQTEEQLQKKMFMKRMGRG